MSMSSPELSSHYLQLSIPIRDPSFYISDGNTILLVENTLFKVHRSRLTKDRSLFESMFSLSSETSSFNSPSTSNSNTISMSHHTHTHHHTPAPTPEGDADEHPIRLPDRADEIRALLWALYALPHELSNALAPGADAALLGRLAHVAHKYQFRSLESWALGALQVHYTRPGAMDTLVQDGPDGPTGPGGLTLEQLTDLAALCERADLLETCVGRWKRNLFEGKDVARAIGVAERLGLRSLLGLAYNGMLLEGRETWDTDPGLSRAQRIRLLSGHYSLGSLWESLPGAVPQLTHSPRCTAQAKCGKAWASLWARTLEIGTKVVSHAYPDVVGKLVLAETFLKAAFSREIPQGPLEFPFCRDAALAATSMRVKEIRDGLADHFTDVL